MPKEHFFKYFHLLLFLAYTHINANIYYNQVISISISYCKKLSKYSVEYVYIILYKKKIQSNSFHMNTSKMSNLHIKNGSSFKN